MTEERGPGRAPARRRPLARRDLAALAIATPRASSIDLARDDRDHAHARSRALTRAHVGPLTRAHVGPLARPRAGPPPRSAQLPAAIPLARQDISSNHARGRPEAPRLLADPFLVGAVFEVDSAAEGREG